MIQKEQEKTSNLAKNYVLCKFLKSFFGRCPLLGQQFFLRCTEFGPFVRCCCCCCCCCCSAAALSAAIDSAAVGCQAASFLLGLHQLLRYCCKCCCCRSRAGQQSLAQICPRTARTHDCTIDTSQPTTVPTVLGRTCLTRPGHDSVAASLRIVWTLICSSDEDLRQTGRIHPDCLFKTMIININIKNICPTNKYAA